MWIAQGKHKLNNGVEYWRIDCFPENDTRNPLEQINQPSMLIDVRRMDVKDLDTLVNWLRDNQIGIRRNIR